MKLIGQCWDGSIRLVRCSDSVYCVQEFEYESWHDSLVIVECDNGQNAAIAVNAEEVGGAQGLLISAVLRLSSQSEKTDSGDLPLETE